MTLKVKSSHKLASTLTQFQSQKVLKGTLDGHSLDKIESIFFSIFRYWISVITSKEMSNLIPNDYTLHLSLFI